MKKNYIFIIQLNKSNQQSANFYHIMCISCLNNVLESIFEFETEIKDFISSITCECDNCDRKLWANFLLGVCQDLQVLIRVNIKINIKMETPSLCTAKLSQFEGNVRLRIKNKLTDMLEYIDEDKEKMESAVYLNKMNQLKDLNDYVVSIEKAFHN